MSIRLVAFQSGHTLEVCNFFQSVIGSVLAASLALGLFRTELAALDPHRQDLDQYFPNLRHVYMGRRV